MLTGQKKRASWGLAQQWHNSAGKRRYRIQAKKTPPSRRGKDRDGVYGKENRLLLYTLLSALLSLLGKTRITRCYH
ncbi:hypothetical protein DF213_17960 [Dickeya dianthicola]|uniref:Uncharacterized protein n=2 Tax=Dickeya dianthicola TaxID=204039 RepID=A0AAX1C2S9_9GAMM|nr:hypothetical protein DF213_17960 [Dickeya dianthicola]